MIKYICDICGAEFDIEHYDGGYIDHMNLANNRYYYSDKLDELIEEIVFGCHETLRCKSDIDKRLDCVMHWNNISDADKEHIKMKVDALYLKHKATKDKAYADANNIAKSDNVYAKYLRDALDANL